MNAACTPYRSATGVSLWQAQRRAHGDPGSHRPLATLFKGLPGAPRGARAWLAAC
jgi:hypothetical protein